MDIYTTIPISLISLQITKSGDLPDKLMVSETLMFNLIANI